MKLSKLFKVFIAGVALFTFGSCTKDTDTTEPKPTEDFLVFENDTLFVPYTGVKDLAFIISAPTDAWAFELTSGSEWCSIKTAQNGADVKTMYFTAAANDTEAERTAIVKVAYGKISKTLTVVQFVNTEVAATRIVPSKMHYEVSRDLGTLQIPVVADGSYKVTVQNGVEWLQYNMQKTVDNQIVEEFYYDGNFAEDMRTAVVTFASDSTLCEVEITQWGTKDLKVSPTALTVGYTAVTDTVAVYAFGSYTVTPSESWITYDEAASKKGTDIAVLKFAQNSTTETRTAYITFQTATTTVKVDVTQVAKGEMDLQDADNYQNDIAATLSSPVSSSNLTLSRNAQKAIDGNTASVWYSNYTTDTAPEISFAVDASKLTQIDYMLYTPTVLSMNWGIWGKVDVYITHKGQGEELYKTLDFQLHSTPTRIDFEPALSNDVTAVRFKIKTATTLTSNSITYTNVASAAEIGLYQTNTANFDPLTIFTDNSLSAIKSGVTYDKILAITDPFYKSIAEQIYYGVYDKFRVCTFNAYPHPKRDADIFRTNTYSLLDNVTGMYVAEAGDEQYVFLDDDHGLPIYVRVIDWVNNEGACSNDSHSTDYALHTGRNVFKPTSRGLMYIMVHTDDYASIPPMKANFVTAKVNGYFDLTKHSADDFYNIFKLGGSGEPHFDMITSRCILNFAKSTINTYAIGGLASNGFRVTKLLTLYDSVLLMEERAMGHPKYKALGRQRVHRNKMLFRTTYGTLYGASSGYNTMYNATSMACDMVNVNKLWPQTSAYNNNVVGSIWGLAHELGHTNQTNGFVWRGLVEVTNNLMCALVQYQLFGEGHTTMRYNDHFNKGMRDIAVRWVTDRDGTERRMTHCESVNSPMVGSVKDGTDPTTQLEPFWQLYIYYHILNHTDFYPNLYEACRMRPSSYTYTDADQAQNMLDFMKMASDAAGEDLSYFCDAWGIPGVNNKMKVTHYGTNYITTTQAQVDDAMAYCHKYPKPKLDPFYINDLNVDLYRNPKPVVAGTHTISATGQFVTSGWQNVVAWKIVNPDNGRTMAVKLNTESFNYSYVPSIYMNNSTGTDYAYSDSSTYASSDSGNNRALQAVTPQYRTDWLLYGVAADGTAVASLSNSK